MFGAQNRNRRARDEFSDSDKLNRFRVNGSNGSRIFMKLTNKLYQLKCSWINVQVCILSDFIRLPKKLIRFKRNFNFFLLFGNFSIFFFFLNFPHFFQFSSFFLAQFSSFFPFLSNFSSNFFVYIMIPSINSVLFSPLWINDKIKANVLEKKHVRKKNWFDAIINKSSVMVRSVICVFICFVSHFSVR